MMGLFDRKKRNGGFMDMIRCDEPNYLIWKWHPTGAQPGKNNRENAIRWGSSLWVREGEVAAFVCAQDFCDAVEYIEGPYDDVLQTSNFPVLASIVGLAYDGGTPFPAEVYFINLARIIQVRFGVPFFDVYDPRFLDFGVPVAVRGTISFRIEDYREFIKLHQLRNFNPEDFQKQIRDAVCRYVKDVVANAPAAHNIPVIQLESKTALINDAVEYDLAQRLKESFGVTVSGVDIGAIEIDKGSDGYARLMAVTRNVTTATVQAQTTAQIKDIHDKQRIDARNYEENLKIQREEAQYASRMQTRTANFAVYQTGKQAEVGVAGANAFGQMNANGAGNMNLGAAGFNPAAVAAGVAMGQTFADMMNNAVSGVNQPVQPGTVSPPIPTVAYHVAINGQAAGPFDMATLQQMAANGQLTASSLVWKIGMTQWAEAGKVEELVGLFPPIPPASKN